MRMYWMQLLASVYHMSAYTHREFLSRLVIKYLNVKYNGRYGRARPAVHTFVIYTKAVPVCGGTYVCVCVWVSA